MDERTTSAVSWLLAADEPAVAHLTRRDLFRENALLDPAAVLAGPWVTALLAGQQADIGFGADPPPGLCSTGSSTA